MSSRSAAALFFISGAVASGLTACYLNSSAGTNTLAAADSSLPAGLAPQEKQLVEIFEKSAKSVVSITNVGTQTVGFFSEVEVERGSGSGIVWDKQGHVVTNHHVISDSKRTTVTLADKSVFNAEVVGYYPDTDTAVLKIDASPDDLHPIRPGRSSDLRVGMTALAIGSPFGQSHTLTVGVISALGREIRAMNNRVITDVIQTDAAINPGNSGGPLLGLSGELIGINTAILSPSGTNSGIGFAVPVDMVKRIVEGIIAGKISRPGLGVSMWRDRERYVIENYLLRTGRLRGRLPAGVLLQEVPEASAVHPAGLRATVANEYTVEQLGDVIIGVDGQRVKSGAELLNLIDRHKIGEEIDLHYYRDGDEYKVKVTLQEIEVVPGRDR